MPNSGLDKFYKLRGTGQVERLLPLPTVDVRPTLEYGYSGPVGGSSGGSNGTEGGSNGTENQQSGKSPSTSENKANENSTLSTIKNYEAIKPLVDQVATTLADKYTPIKGLGKYLTAFDIAKDKYLYDNDYITGKRFTYRTTGNIVSLATAGIAGPAVTVGEFTYDYMCSLTSWINNTLTTQNFLNSNLFPH